MSGGTSLLTNFDKLMTEMTGVPAMWQRTLCSALLGGLELQWKTLNYISAASTRK